MLITHFCDSKFQFTLTGPLPPIQSTGTYSLTTTTTSENTLRLLRALQLARPILLEGSPGVGKTSLVTALAMFSGNQLTRINLSEQTVGVLIYSCFQAEVFVILQVLEHI